MAQITSLSQLDPNGLYSYADYLSWRLEEAIELIRGRLLKISGPDRRHQRISRELSGQFYLHFQQRHCEFYAAPFDVRLPDQRKSALLHKDIHTVVQPDLCIICDPAKLDDRGCLGAPDLIVEILSPGNAAKEMRLKKDLYEESGVLEYWIFDPERETVLQLHLTELGAYSLPRVYINEDVLQSAIFPDLRIELAEVFRDRLME